MKCRYCNIALAPLRSLTDGEFCCDDHRHAFHEEQHAGSEVAPVPPLHGGLLPLQVSLENARADAPRPIAPLELNEFKPAFKQPDSKSIQPEFVRGSFPQADGLAKLKYSAAPVNRKPAAPLAFTTELEFQAVPTTPKLRAQPIRIDVASEAASMPLPDLAPVVESEPRPAAQPERLLAEEAATLHPYHDVAHSWQWLKDVWRNAPSDLKTITLLLPVLLAVALAPSVPKIKVAPISGGQVQQVLSTKLTTLHQSILNRAAVDFTDDFRSGLDAWDSHSNLTSSWSYDASGFVQPGPLAVFKPTTDMTDYRFQFLGEIDQKAMGCAFRAADLDNYYAVKLTVVKPGPLPMVRLVRYPVINGKEGKHVEKPLPMTARADTLYRILVDVRGSDFTIMAQGQVVDFWSDSRLPRGGVGFFCARGEKARVRWVEVSHQYDALGRLCAYLAPYGFEGRNGNWN